MKDQATKIIEEITNSDLTTSVETYTSFDEYFNYYHRCSGFLNGKYFAVTFQSVNNVEKIRFAHCCDDLEGFKKQFNLE